MKDIDRLVHAANFFEAGGQSQDRSGGCRIRSPRLREFRNRGLVVALLLKREPQRVQDLVVLGTKTSGLAVLVDRAVHLPKLPRRPRQVDPIRGFQWLERHRSREARGRFVDLTHALEDVTQLVQQHRIFRLRAELLLVVRSGRFQIGIRGRRRRAAAASAEEDSAAGRLAASAVSGEAGAGAGARGAAGTDAGSAGCATSSPRDGQVCQIVKASKVAANVAPAQIPN